MKRLLGPVDGAALIVSNVIGVGIFVSPGIVAEMVPDPIAFLGVWFVGGLLAFIGALAYAELATMLPHAGGEYLYLSKAFGPLAGFLSGWTSFVAGFSGAIAAAAVGFAAYLGRFFPLAADTHPLISWSLGIATFDVSPQTLIAFAVVFAVSAAHVWGVQAGRWLQNALAAGSLLALVLLLAVGFLIGSPPDTAFERTGGSTGVSAWLLALIPVMFTYSGWNAAVYVAEEVRDPGRNMLRALVLGTVLVVVLYVLLNVLYLYALPISALAGTIEVGDVVAEVLLGPLGASALTIVILFALASSVSAMVMTGPRIYFAMARDGLFPRPAGRLHARLGTPAAAIIAQALWSAMLIMTGTFEQLLLYTGSAVVLFSSIAVMALFILRRTQATVAAHKKRFGAHWGAALFIIAGLSMVVNALFTDPGPTLSGLIVMGGGVPLFWWFKKRRLSGSSSSA